MSGFLAFVIALTVGLLPSGGAARTTQVATDQMVALGDSYAAGVGSRIYYADSGTCYRSPASYPVTIATGAGLALDFRACSGAAVADVRSTQTRALSPSTRYVTVTVGGNDVSFAPVLTECAKPSWWGNCNGRINDALQILRTQLPARLAGLYAEIRTRAPQATVVVTGYPLLFNGQDCNLLTFFSPAEEQRLNDATNELDALIQSQATAAGFTFADPRPAFAGHAVCDRPEYLNGASYPIINSYHPNSSGHAAYAAVVQPALAIPAGATARAVVHSDVAAPLAAAAPVFRVPDLRSAEARAAAKAAGIGPWQLAKLQLAQVRAMSGAWWQQVDQTVAAGVGRLTGN